MALPETENMVTVRRLSAVVSGVWEKAKGLFATKVANPTNGNFAGLDSNGNLTDSGSKASDFATASQGTAADSAIQGVQVDGTDLVPDANKKVNVQLPQASTAVPLMDGNATAGTATAWAKGDHVHPADTSKQDVANMDSSITTTPSEGHYPSTSAVADFVNSSISTNTANFLGSFTLTDLGLPYPATDAEIAIALASHAWPTGTPTNNDYVYVEIQDPQTTGVDDRVERFKYSGTLGWEYEYTLNNSSFTAAEVAALESGVTAAKVSNYDSHIANTSNPHNVTKSQVGLGNVVNTGDSATPISGGTTKFTTGGAYTELAKKVDKETGKGLSTNDFTTAYKDKLDGIAAGAEVNVQSSWTETDSNSDAYIKNKPTLATVATSGSYNDLSNKPTIPAAQVNSDWNATSGVAQIKNKPTLATVATSGSYTDLSNKPTIPAAANNGTLTITQNGTSKGTFSANQSSNNTIALTDTTYSAGAGISLSGTEFSNSGVRDVSWFANTELSVNVGGVTKQVTINKAVAATSADYAGSAGLLTAPGGAISLGAPSQPVYFKDGVPARVQNDTGFSIPHRVFVGGERALGSDWNSATPITHRTDAFPGVSSGTSKFHYRVWGARNTSGTNGIVIELKWGNSEADWANLSWQNAALRGHATWHYLYSSTLNTTVQRIYKDIEASASGISTVIASSDWGSVTVSVNFRCDAQFTLHPSISGSVPPPEKYFIIKLSFSGWCDAGSIPQVYSLISECYQAYPG